MLTFIFQVAVDIKHINLLIYLITELWSFNGQTTTASSETPSKTSLKTKHYAT